MLTLLFLIISQVSFATSSVEVLSTIKLQQQNNKPCAIAYNVQESEKSALFKSLDASNFSYFSEEGNLLVTWGPKEKGQLQKLRDNKIILDKILDKGFDPNNIHPKFIEQLNLLKELTTKCK